MSPRPESAEELCPLRAEVCWLNRESAACVLTLDPGHDATMDSKVKSNAEIRRSGMGLRVPHRTHTFRLPGLVAVSFTARPGEAKYRFNAIKGRRL